MKKSYIAILLIIVVAFMAMQNNDTDTAFTAVTSAIEEVAEYSEQESDGGDSDSDSDSDSEYRWGNLNTLPDHFERHGADFDAKDAQDYARQAHEFYESRDQYQIKNDDGILRIYDSKTNTFGAYNKNGTTRTFYKPDAGQAYFDRQPGS